MAKIYIHIGPPKTGSSALQTFLSKNIDVLREKGFLYPEIGGREDSWIKIACSDQPTPGNAYPLIESFFSDRSTQDNITREEQLRLFGKYLEKNKEYNIILSSEYFSEPGIPYDALENFYTIFRRTHEPKILIYLRRQDYWIQSRYAHGIRIPEIMETEKLDGLCLQRYIKKCTLRPILETYSSIFGTDNIHVRCYEKEQYNGGNIFTDLLYVLGLGITDERYIFPDKPINTNLPQYALEFIRILNKNNPSPSAKWLLDNEIRKATDITFRDWQFLSTAERMKILNAFKDENNWIARTFLGRESGILFYEELPNGSRRAEKIHFDFNILTKLMATIYTALASVLFDSVMRLDMSRKQLSLLERKLEEAETKSSEIQQRLSDIEKTLEKAETKSSEIQQRLSDIEKTLMVVFQNISPRAIFKNFIKSLIRLLRVHLL